MRIVIDQLGKMWGQQTVLMNQPGARDDEVFLSRTRAIWAFEAAWDLAEYADRSSPRKRAKPGI